MSTLLERVAGGIITGDVEESRKAVTEALKNEIPPHEILDNGLMAAMERVGFLFQEGEIFIPDVFFSAKAMHGSMDILRPLLAPSKLEAMGTVVIGTVLGDIHDIGKRLVATMLEGAGFTVIDLGVEVSPEAFVQAVEKHQPHIVAMSTLLTTTMVNMGATVETLVKAGVRDQVKVLIGGAPVSRPFAEEIGADGYGSNALTGVEEAKALLESLKGEAGGGR
jgi:5-methyltetrahydrofolate--homocysteine methyltransferase